MPQYIFALGRIPAISLAELYYALPAVMNPDRPNPALPPKPGEKLVNDKPVKVAMYQRISNNWLLVDLPEELPEPQAFLDRLGGCTKIIKVLENDLQPKDLPAHLSDHAARTFADREDKIRYAMSVYNLNNAPEKILKSCLLETKKKLKSSGLSSRFINNNFHNPPTAQLTGEKILQKGAEFCAIELAAQHGQNAAPADKKIWLIGQTVAIQNINKYSERDFERPDRDPRQGMLPPKLAQILINLSGAGRGPAPHTNAAPDATAATSAPTIYDPFCGIGTVLMEGLLMGLNVVGSDLNAENIAKTRNNLEWLATKYSGAALSSPATGKVRLFHKDATKIQKSDLPENIAAIVTETFLGPPVSQLPSASQIELNIAQVEHLIYGFLENIHPLLEPGTRLAMTMLCYKDGHHFIHLDHLFENLTKIGFERETILPPEFLAHFNMPREYQYGLIYDRPDQIVAREIVVLKKVQK